MKGYVRLKQPDEEVFLGEGAGCVSLSGGQQFRVWDRSGLTLYLPGERLVSIRLGTGQRPAEYEPLPGPQEDL